MKTRTMTRSNVLSNPIPPLAGSVVVVLRNVVVVEVLVVVVVVDVVDVVVVVVVDWVVVVDVSYHLMKQCIMLPVIQTQLPESTTAYGLRFKPSNLRKHSGPTWRLCLYVST